jgi:hypothetical protein
VSAAVRVLERVRTFAPLGIRFWDAALDVPVDDRLVVHAWLRGAPNPPVRAVRSPGGVYAFHGLPGQPRTPGDRPELEGEPREYSVAVDDPSGRWLPAAFGVTLPLGYRGEFLSAPAGSPPESGGRAYLFPAAGRVAPPGLAAIRADLVDEATGAPAAWAVLAATVAGVTRTGIADERGRVTLLLPFPTPDRLRDSSPPAAAGPAEWPATVTARWEPGALRHLFPEREGLDPAWAARPSLRSILDEQGGALLRSEEGQDAAAEWADTLVHGRELVLRTALAGGGHAPTVWISAGAPSP